MAATKPDRRHLRLTITEDMKDLWAWFQDVRPRAAAREVEFLLRLGVLHATGPWTTGASAAPAPAAPVGGQAEGALRPAVEEPVRARASGFNHAEALQI